MGNIICRILGHAWRDSVLDAAIFERWGVLTCDRCNQTNAAPYEGWV